MNGVAADRSKFGFPGMGAMGSRIAKHLLKRGFAVTVFDRNTEKANGLAGEAALLLIPLPN